MKYLTIVDENYVTKIPKDLVEAMNLGPGDTITWEVDKNKTIIIRKK